ncbi:MAG: glycosyltransferase family 2 protein [Proteobacteria bacterium]|nr:glycosyltransferase family 2 protein [Cystobacterineae bacterium]MCL2258203.1 glycosyltransferase family 2 protein [Cystobacterineae bacterium]MCL2315453.1 glycosyltransferase family 2 protein [Pseudomonadota bacterium]
MPAYAVIVPTLNEARNVTTLTRRLEKVLAHLDWEVVFVDDGSTDGTVEELRSLALHNPRVRFLRRVGRRGLASACVEGMMSTVADCLAVMDADLQHDECLLPAMFGALASGEANLVVASRYLEEGGTGSWDKNRVGLSKFATWLASKSMKVACSDPMSGFFALNRGLIDAVAEKVQSRGFKILFDILTQPTLRLSIKEFPYIFRERAVGSTKLSYPVIMDFAWLLLSRTLSGFAYAQFAMFCLVGLLGVGVHMAILFFLHRRLGLSFLLGQSFATLCAMTSNYFLNNWLTFGRQRLRGLKALLIGYGKFVAACVVGAFANVASAEFLQSHGVFWWLAAGVGIAMGAFINYFFSRFLIWK